LVAGVKEEKHKKLGKKRRGKKKGALCYRKKKRHKRKESPVKGKGDSSTRRKRI